jgi:hypothetical protein
MKTPESDKKPVSVRLNELKSPLMEISQKEDRSLNYLIKAGVKMLLSSKGVVIKQSKSKSK